MAAAETAPVAGPALAPVPGLEPEAVPARAPPSKRRRAYVSAANDVDFVIFSSESMGYNVVTTWVSTMHYRALQTIIYLGQVCRA
ncbi:hypothetical protein DPMN_156364 [Dreissena polymorpha]|uniref:Uncharacterized protein n=1 Tax=Dreissena polymorpha TaxID=45954 RepID=A0A9D4J8R1_DREPO|nr:hypothetical protein DPMN_156364 [Dreissena polymorpha]